ncbi:elongation of very long chain fatty acids protein 7-like [Hylaeus volcanicus]|uniref:elongation of very long chain fatty acids protein 7-like n=1 Tax=Hylaeus volcanicus TaxID=313075 RepID=UPI0023B7D36A|nr:elongation of very long chain fatty acids protein 7-like [Hylaeus volcanicus]
MALLIRRIYEMYRYVNDELSDPRTQDFFLIGSPWACLGIVGFYLYFVQELGPRLMEKRKPFKLDRVIQIYNIIQIVFCAYVLYKAMILAWLFHYSFYCEPVDYSNDPRALEIAKTVWMYFMAKMFDLVDTVFFVLRKKQNQVSFLHVYHHSGMAFGTWAATKFMAGGHITFLGTLNCFVHVVMYSYYLATSFRMSKPWWKKYITQLQLTQFFLILVHFILLAWVDDCGFPKWVAAVLIPQNLFMIVLFGDFYYKAYIKKPRPKVAQNGFSAEGSNGNLKSQNSFESVSSKFIDMTSIIREVVNNYEEFAEITKEINLDSWTMMSSPGPMLCIVACYLAFVLKIGPKMMEKRPPFQVNSLLIAYNAFQVVFSVWLTLKGVDPRIWKVIISPKCNAAQTSKDIDLQTAVVATAYWYFIGKLTELLDTVFFVLRKKQNQVSFLHVYHHTVLVVFGWVYVKYLPGEQGAMLGILNSFVHIVMYTYYLIAALGAEYKKYLWWKKYMTCLQLVQFVMMLCYLMMTLAMDCKVPKTLTYFFMANVVLFLYLFGDFYRKSYTKKSI